MGMDSPELLLLVENCPKGAETLVTRVIHILTDKGDDFLNSKILSSFLLFTGRIIIIIIICKQIVIYYLLVAHIQLLLLLIIT